MKSLNYYRSLLMEEINEKELSKKQMDIADEAEPFDKITGADFKALRAKKDMKDVVDDYTKDLGKGGHRQNAIIAANAKAKKAMKGMEEHHNDPNFPGGDRKSTRLNSSHVKRSRMPSSA